MEDTHGDLTGLVDDDVTQYNLLDVDRTADKIVVNGDPAVQPPEPPKPLPRIGRSRAEAALRTLFPDMEGRPFAECSLRWCVGALTERRDAETGQPLKPRAPEMFTIFGLLVKELGPLSITLELAMAMTSLEEACQYIAGLPDRGRTT